MVPSMWFTVSCDCGWSYGKALQTDALQQSKWHKNVCPLHNTTKAATA